MPTARSLLALVATDNYLYAIGGRVEGGESTSVVEKYKCETDTWSPVERMHKPRSAAATAVLNNSVYIMGGATMNNSYETASVERYDEKTNKWTMVTYKLCIQHFFFYFPLFQLELYSQ